MDGGCSPSLCLNLGSPGRRRPVETMNGLLHAHCDLPQLRRELSSQLEEVDAQISATIDVTEFRRVAGDLSRHEDGLDSLCESLAGYEVSCRDLAGSLSWVLAQTKAKLDAKALVHQQRERLQLQLRIEQTRVHLEQLLDGASSAAGAHRPPEGWAAEVRPPLHTRRCGRLLAPSLALPSPPRRGIDPHGLARHPQGTRRTGTAADSDEVLRAAREMGRLRLLRQRGAEEQLRAVHLGTEQWERLQTRLLSRLTTALREALEARDEARVAQAVVGFVDAGSAAEAEQWIRLEWVAPRLGPRLQHAARGGERDAFARVCAEVSKNTKLFTQQHLFTQPHQKNKRSQGVHNQGAAGRGRPGRAATPVWLSRGLAAMTRLRA